MSERDAQSGIGKQQQEELRRLSQLLQSGQISGDQYKRKRDRILAKAAALTATSRGADGLVSTKAITVEKSMNPLVLKGAIAAVVVAVVAQVGYIVVKKVAAYEPTLEEVAENEPESAPVPDAAPDVDAAPVTTAAATPPEPMAAAVSEPIAEVEVAEVGAVSVRPAVEAEAVSVRPDPVSEPVAPMSVQSAASAAPPTGPTLVWDVPFPDHELSQTHPFRKWCDRVKQIVTGRLNGTIGVKLGPVAADFNDPAYTMFRDELRNDFRNRIGMLEPNLEFNTVPPGRTGRIIAERMTGADRRSTDIAVLVTTVQDGRAFAYYFAGPNMMLRTFNDQAVGAAKVAEPAADDGGE